MKRYIVAGLVLVSMVFTGCDFFIDQIEVHNGLVVRSDKVAEAEVAFYDEYWALSEDADTSSFLTAYKDFSAAADDLEKYVNETKFSSRQTPIINEYNDYYKPVLDGYVEAAGALAAAVEKDGYNFDALESYFAPIDEYTVSFVSANDSFETVINSLSDYSL